MRHSLLDWLQCPGCQGMLTCDVASSDGDHVMEGRLRCTACPQTYPVRRGVPRFVAHDLPILSRRTAEVFGDQWKNRSPALEPYYRQQLAAWIQPLGLEGLHGRTVLDAGCGKGRHIGVAIDAGAQQVVGVDLSDAVDVAFDHTRALPQAHIVQADLCALPLKRAAFDAVLSIGVLHHLPRPQQGVAALAQLLAANGRLAIWVYGAEGNRWVRWIRWGSSPFRPPTFPASWLWLATVIPALILYVWLRGFIVPLKRWRPAWLAHVPYHRYLAAICGFPWRELHAIIYDQLAAPIAHYSPHDEVRRWFTTAGLSMVHLESVHGNSWSAVGTHDAGG